MRIEKKIDHSALAGMARSAAAGASSEEFRSVFMSMAKAEDTAENIENITDRLKGAEEAVSGRIVHRRFMPDGSIMITETEDGKVVSRFKKKPHMVPMPDPSGAREADGSVKMTLVPRQNVFDLLTV